MTAFIVCARFGCLAISISWGLLATACTSLEPRNPVPKERADEAGIPGVPLARWWGAEFPIEENEIAKIWRGVFEASNRDIRNTELTLLGLSGGGANGAFGAGLLVGWTEAGDRPEFYLVTGVSTGALIAPFAFLGPDYDDSLRAVFTESATDDILTRRGLITGLRDEALASTEPLANLIAKHVDEDIIRAI